MRQSYLGIAYAFSSMFLWGLFPVMVSLSLRGIPPLWSASIGTLASVLFFLIVIILRGEWKAAVSPACKRQIAVASLFIGVGYYAAQYVGIGLTTPGNAAIVSLMEIFFSFLFLSVLLRHERLIAAHVLGALFMVAGACIILVPSASAGVHTGDFIILVGCVLPPLGNLAMQRARKEVSSAFIMFWRSLTGSVVIGLLAYALEGPLSFDEIRASLPVLFFTGFVLLGLSKIFWIEAINLLPITQTISISAMQPLLAIVFAYFILSEPPKAVQFLSLVPIIIGMMLLTRPATPRSAPPVPASL